MIASIFDELTGNLRKDLHNIYLAIRLNKVNTEEKAKYALACLSEMSHKGYWKATNLLGEIYENGIICDRNLMVAFNFYREATYQIDDYDFLHDNDEYIAYCNLANCYLRGKGTEQNIDEAKRFINKAFEYENGYVYLLLGLMYEEGLGEEINPKEAFNNYRKGYQKRNWHTESFKEIEIVDYIKGKLGKCYLYGIGVEVNLEEALYYLESYEIDLACRLEDLEELGRHNVELEDEYEDLQKDINNLYDLLKLSDYDDAEIEDYFENIFSK